MADFRLSQQLECAEWVAPERSQWGWSGTGNTFIPQEGGGVNELEDISWNKAMLSFWVIRKHWMGKASCFLGHRSGVMILTMDAGKSLVIKSDFSGKFCPSLPTPAEEKISVNREAEMLNECMLAHFRLFKPCALYCVFCLDCYYLAKQDHGTKVVSVHVCFCLYWGRTCGLEGHGVSFFFFFFW